MPQASISVPQLDQHSGFWARITGPSVDGGYPWQEVVPVFTVGGGLTSWEDYPPRSSDTTDTPAYPAFGGLAATDDIVWMFFAPDRRHFLFLMAGASSGGGSLTVKEVDGTPTVTAVTELRFDQADGFALTEVSTGVARLDILPATNTQAGVVSTGVQQFGGRKNFNIAGLAASDVQIPGNAFITSPFGSPPSNFHVWFSSTLGLTGAIYRVVTAAWAYGEVVILSRNPDGGGTSSLHLRATTGAALGHCLLDGAYYAVRLGGVEKAGLTETVNISGLELTFSGGLYTSKAGTFSSNNADGGTF